MRSAGKRQLSLVVLLSAAGCPNYCEMFPSDSQCQITIQPIAEIKREINLRTEIKVLPQDKILPDLHLSFMADLVTLIHTDVDQGRLYVSFSLADLAKVPKGPADLYAELKGRRSQKKVSTWLSTTPVWPNVPAALTYTGKNVATAAFVAQRPCVTPPCDHGPSLFVSETINNGSQQQLARFDIVSSEDDQSPLKLVRDTSFEKVTTTMYRDAVYAPSQDAVLVYYAKDTMTGELGVISLFNGRFLSQQEVALHAMPLMRAELDGPLRVLTSGSSDPLLAFNLGINTTYRQITAPIKPTAVKQLWVAEQMPASGGKLASVVALDGNGSISFLSSTSPGGALVSDPVLAEDATRSDSEQKTYFFRDTTLRGISMGDIDQDGYPDLVTTVVRDVMGQQQRQLAWLPHRPLVVDAAPAFGDWHYVNLPSAPDIVTDMVLGNLDGEKGLDVVLVGPNAVVCYFNQAQ